MRAEKLRNSQKDTHFILDSLPAEAQHKTKHCVFLCNDAQ